MLFNAKVDNKKFFTLADKYIVPPFSVFDKKQKYWAERVSFWNKLGIKSELGRGGNGTNFGKTFGVFEKAKFSGAISETSIFDPVLCEIMYRWFSPERESARFWTRSRVVPFGVLWRWLREDNIRELI